MSVSNAEFDIGHGDLPVAVLHRVSHLRVVCYNRVLLQFYKIGKFENPYRHPWYEASNDQISYS